MTFGADGPPPGYVDCCRQLAVLFRIWIDVASRDRFVNVQFYHWDRIVYAGALSGVGLDFLCATPDAREMCEWADEQTRPPGTATLFQAYVVAEQIGLKTPGSGPVVPASVLNKHRSQIAVFEKNGRHERPS